MKKLEDLVFPDEYRYSKEHEWAVKDGDLIKVGITDYAQDQLGDVVYVEFPEIGNTFEKDAAFGSLESVKAVSEVFLPVGGEIVEMNEALMDQPELINNDPNGTWIVKIKAANESELESLMSKGEYLNQLDG